MIGPVNPSSGRLRPLGLDAVRIDGGFWGDLQARNAEAILPHCHEWIERVGWLGNMRRAGAGTVGPDRPGRNFSDSEIYKLAEAMSWHGSLPDELARTIAAAQQPDGYLNTYYGLPGRDPRYTDLGWGHELYCLGHLIQAGVARLRTGVEDALTATAIRAADHVCEAFGPTGRAGVCGHPEIEMALVELYRQTGVARYLEQAKLFVDRRGYRTLPDIEFGPAYFQDDVPVRDRVAFSGHAVRELYLACGAVDVAVEAGDAQLLDALVRQWERTVAARVYLTGGMGARHEGESFGEDFELPSDRAYAETCAGVASVMLCWRLLLATGDARFADLAERTLYNVVAAAPALDGRGFFYTNPLQKRVPGPRPDPAAPNPRAASGERAPWFDVSCCPTNVARTLAALAGYLATGDERGIQLHQFASGSVRGPVGEVRVETGYPWQGSVTVRVVETMDRPWQLSLRVPAWARGADVIAPDRRPQPVRSEYARIERPWRVGEEVRLLLPVRPRWTVPDPRIDAVRGCVAIERGPLVYCAESVDQTPPATLDSVSVDVAAAPAERPEPALGPQVVAVEVPATAHPAPADAGWPYTTPDGDRSAGAAGSLVLVPYHLWANRGPGTMRVWLPSDR